MYGVVTVSIIIIDHLHHHDAPPSLPFSTNRNSSRSRFIDQLTLFCEENKEITDRSISYPRFDGLPFVLDTLPSNERLGGGGIRGVMQRDGQRPASHMIYIA